MFVIAAAAGMSGCDEARDFARNLDDLIAREIPVGSNAAQSSPFSVDMDRKTQPLRYVRLAPVSSTTDPGTTSSRSSGTSNGQP
jgi:hypothetical protein